MVSLLMGQSSPELEHFQELELTDAEGPPFQLQNSGSRTGYSFVCSGPPWGIWLCLEDPSTPAPFLHTLAKQGWAEPLSFSFLLENMQSWSR